MLLNDVAKTLGNKELFRAIQKCSREGCFLTFILTTVWGSDQKAVVHLHSSIEIGRIVVAVLLVLTFYITA